MTAIRATRTPAGAPPTGTGPESARYRASAPWPGITSGHDARCSCTWAARGGVYQVKYRDALCGNHIRAVSGG